MLKGKETPEPPARRGMRNGRDGGVAAEEEGKAVSTKRLRRPNVRLHQPYYENPGHRKLQQQWKAFKKDLEGAKRNRVLKTANVKGNNNDEVSDGTDDDEMEGLNFDDDVVIGRWKDFNACNRDRGFKSKAKRKRVRPSSSKKWASVKSNENDGRENEKFFMSSGGESEKQDEEGGEEENVGADGINNDFEPRNPDPSNNSSGNDDGSDKLSDGNNIVGGSKERQRMMKGESEKGSFGVRVWLSQMGLGKYAPIFEVHEVEDDVLPFLTLEDLKDMGISAVGSRRKMYNSIQKLNKGFS